MSQLVEHAERELRHLLNHPDPDERGVALSVLNAVRGFASYEGHSGGSASVAIDWIHRLLQWQNIGPLTDDPDEWMYVGHASGPDGPTWQSRRRADAFSEDCGKTHYLLDEDRWVGWGSFGPWRRRLKRNTRAHRSAPHQPVDAHA